jgi:catechol 2,3-dioxygenase-like lactoylglutathione lyase family enzyme
MKFLFQKFLLLIFLFSNIACQPSEKFVRERGVISAFSELVNAGVKQMALSGTMSADEMDKFMPFAIEEAKRYNVLVFRESELIKTNLFPEDIAKDQDVLVLYQGNTLDAYLKLKQDKAALLKSEGYSLEASYEISRRFGRLLSYTPKKINSLLSENTEFRVMSDFGVKATNVFLYYRDLPKATAFYTETLGLRLLAEYDNASVIGVTPTSLVILVDEAKGMHSAEEPKSVALAFLTNQLADWYDYALDQKIPIKYTYQPKDGGPHDGFVAIDPEGYLLEFETFKQHEENERFIPVLEKAPDVLTSVSHNGNELGFNATITWLYYQDLLGMQGFYENTMGLELVGDQGWTKIYQASPTGFVGLVDELRGMNDYSDTKAVNISFLINDLDAWLAYSIKHKPFELRRQEMGVGPEGKYRAFVGYDPEKYFMEFDKFYEHKDNLKLMKFLQQEE